MERKNNGKKKLKKWIGQGTDKDKKQKRRGKERTRKGKRTEKEIRKTGKGTQKERKRKGKGKEKERNREKEKRKGKGKAQERKRKGKERERRKGQFAFRLLHARNFVQNTFTRGHSLCGTSAIAAESACLAYLHGWHRRWTPTSQQESLCAFCREVVPTKPFTNTALYYKMMLESEPTPPATKCFWVVWWWIKSQCRSLQNDFT